MICVPAKPSPPGVASTDPVTESRPSRCNASSSQPGSHLRPRALLRLGVGPRNRHAEGRNANDLRAYLWRLQGCKPDTGERTLECLRSGMAEALRELVARRREEAA